MHDREPPPFSRPSAPPPPPGADYPAIVTQAPRRRRRPVPQPRQKKRGGSWLGLIFGTILTLVVLVGVGLTVLLTLHPPGQIVRDQLVSRTLDATGRQLTLSGETGLEFWPSLAVTLRDVTLSAPPGMNAPPTLKAETASAAVAVWPLISGKVVIEGITLRKPEIDLRKDRTGRTSWSVADRARQRGAVQYAQAAAGTATDSALAFGAPGLAGGDALERIELQRISISDGTVVYTDEQAGQTETVMGLNADVTGRGLRDPMKLVGNLATRGETFRFNGDIANPRALADGQSTNVTFALSSGVVDVSAKGAVVGGNTPQFQGPVTTKITRLDRFARLIDHRMPNGASLGAFELDGDLRASAKAVALAARRLGLGETVATGDLAVALAGQRPRINANLKINQVDIGAIAKGFEGFKAVKPVRRAAPVGAKRAGKSKPKSIDDILRGTQSQTKPQVRGYRSINGWPADPLPFAALRTIDANMTLALGPVVHETVKFDSSALRIQLSNGRGKVHIDSVKMYGGSARGVIEHAPQRKASVVKANIRTTKAFSAERLLTAFAKTDMMSGSANLGFNVTGQGTHIAGIMQTLAGAAELKVNDGALNGYNIAEMIRGLQQGRLDGLNRSPTAKTDFTEMTASFKIAKGIATNRDLRASSPLLRITGEGQIDLGRRQLDYLVKPKLVATLAGQGGNDASGLTVPARVTGSWDDPKIEPQVGDILTQQPVIRDAARKVREQFKGKKTEEVVRDLLKDNGRGATDMLKGIFGR